MMLNLPPATLTQADWEGIVSVFAPDSIYLPTIAKLRAASNEPQMAKDIFEGSLINQGNEHVNGVLRVGGSRYRLTLIGAWKKAERDTRKLAFVYLTDEILERLKRKGA